MGIFNLKGMDFLFQPNSMLAIWLIIARSLLPYNPVKNSLYKILMESTYLSLSQSEFYQESIRSIRTLSGCVGECNLQPWVRISQFAHLKHAK